MIRLGASQCVKYGTVPLPQIKMLPQILQTPKTAFPFVQSVRTSFYTRLPAEKLWKSLITVSNAGKKRGRGRGLDARKAKDLNRGQIVGVGQANIYWPGLTGPVVKGSEMLPQRKLQPDPSFMENIIKIRDSLGKRKRVKLHPLERGWSGTRILGRKLGPPDPIGEEKFENFESVILELRGRLYMTSNFGKKRKNVCMAVVGNKNGIAGIARVLSNDPRGAVKSSRKRATQRLMYFNRCNDKTIYHDFCGQFGRTQVFVTKKHEGYGIKCHRALKSISECIGITDFHAKVEGSSNLLNVVKAFLSGLLQQKTYQEIANEKKMHVVQVRPERDFYPEVLASPSVVLAPEEAKKDPHSFSEYVLGNRVVYKRNKIMKPFEKAQGWERHLKKTLFKRNHDKVAIQLFVEHGNQQSFYYDLYKECRKQFVFKEVQESEA